MSNKRIWNCDNTEDRILALEYAVEILYEKLGMTDEEFAKEVYKRITTSDLR